MYKEHLCFISRPTTQVRTMYSKNDEHENVESMCKANIKEASGVYNDVMDMSSIYSQETFESRRDISEREGCGKKK